MADVGRLRALRSTVLNHPREWDQSNWAKRTECGTTMCLAGWACTLAGREIDWNPGFDMTPEEYLNEYNALVSGTLLPSDDFSVTSDYIASFAEEWLGLTLEEASDLFYAFSNDSAMSLLEDLIETYSD
jgi:hypothetical protein